MKHDIKVKWTGSYPSLCGGSWEIIVDGHKLTNLIDEHFDTYGTYSTWYFENWSEVWEEYTDGLEFEQWKENPPNNLVFSLKLAGFKITDELLKELYVKIQSEDWRHNSCGGCI